MHLIRIEHSIEGGKKLEFTRRSSGGRLGFREVCYLHQASSVFLVVFRKFVFPGKVPNSVYKFSFLLLLAQRRRIKDHTEPVDTKVERFCLMLNEVHT